MNSADRARAALNNVDEALNFLHYDPKCAVTPARRAEALAWELGFVIPKRWRWRWWRHRDVYYLTVLEGWLYAYLGGYTDF